MLTTMDSSPTGCSINAALTTCSSPTAADPSSTTTEQCREQLASPPKQDTFCAKRPSSRTKHSNRHQPYPDGAAKSPGSYSSDGGDSAQSDGDAESCTRGHSKVKRVAANSRERKRMHTVNSAFDQLRELVPTYPSNRKLSKIDTLRLACTYIQDLVSLLHNTQGIQGEDVLYHQPLIPDTFHGYPVSVKQEIPEFAPFTDHFRMQPAAACLRFPPDSCPETYASSASSESDSTTHSPPHPFMQQQQAPPPPARPPPLTRVSSEATASIHTRLAEASISSGQVSPIMTLPPPPPPPPLPSSGSTYQRQVNITSPLAMHAVHHNSTQNLLHSSLEHHSPPVWQRPSPIPTGFALYGQ